MLSRNEDSPNVEFAQKFETFVPRTFDKQRHRILYIGKATQGDCKDLNPAMVYKEKQSQFWYFGRRISECADKHVKDYCNLAWSNLFKQGVVRGNPLSKHAELQRAEAVAALREEVREYRPTLIVLVNAGYYEEITKAAYQMRPGGGPSSLIEEPIDIKGLNPKFDLWWRPAYEEFPPIVWMWHPQGKRREYLDAAALLIKRVGGW